MNAKLLLGIAAAALSSGCQGGSVVGDWQASEPVGSERNTMWMDEAGTGAATIWVVQIVEGAPTSSAFEFDLDWRPHRRDLDRYDLDLHCVTSPWDECDDGDSFDMDCRFEADLEELRCEGENNFRDYDALDWVKKVEP